MNFGTHESTPREPFPSRGLEIVPDVFGDSELKEGSLFVQGPLEVLEQLVAVRLRLDDSGSEDGPLRAVPGSHLRGSIATDEALAIRSQAGEVICEGLGPADASALVALLFRGDWQEPAARFPLRFWTSRPLSWARLAARGFARRGLLSIRRKSSVTNWFGILSLFFLNIGC